MHENASPPTMKVNRLRKMRQSLIDAHSEREQRKLPKRTYEQNETASGTTLYGVPLEILDIILEKSFLHLIWSSLAKQRNEEVIKSLISVDICFNRRITRQRFKKAIWLCQKEFYAKTKKRLTVLRNNRKCLIENIDPSDELIASLLSLNCITEKQSHVIKRQHSKRTKNAELLYVVRTFNDAKFAKLVNILRQTNQMAAARIVDDGGVAIEVKVTDVGASPAATINLLHQGIRNLQSSTKEKSLETEELTSQLKKKDTEILNTQPDGQRVVVWIWCGSQAALQNLQELYEMNQLADALLGFDRPSSSEISQVISIDSNEFKKNVVVCPIFIHLSTRIDVGLNEEAWGVTKLRDEIYVLCRSFPQVIRVFRDRRPFLLLKKLQMKEIKSFVDIGSSEKENCIYVSDYSDRCIWKITREADDQYKVIKWLTTDYEPFTLSVLNDGRLLVRSKSPEFWIYESDATLRSVQFLKDLTKPRCAVVTSIGNFIVLHQWKDREEVEQYSGTSLTKKWKKKWVVSELSRNGQMVIRRFIPSNAKQELKDPNYLFLDSGDRVLVADTENHRVILLNSDLQWNRILCPTDNEEKEEEKDESNSILRPIRLYYDARMKQLIVGGDLHLNKRKAVGVYTLKQY